MADFDLTQTDQQVQNILNDAQDAMGAGAQTTLTTDYIMLKGTNGRYHKILKDSFTEAVRNVLAGLLVNNDKGTTISQIPAIASGDFGSVTPANLASVLGGILHFKYLLKKTLTAGVAETFTGYGTYFIDAGYWGCVIIHVRNDAYSEIFNGLSASLQISVSGNVVSITSNSPFQVTITKISWD